MCDVRNARIQLSPDKDRTVLDDLSAVAKHLYDLAVLFPETREFVIGLGERIDEDVMQLIVHGALDEPKPKHNPAAANCTERYAKMVKPIYMGDPYCAICGPVPSAGMLS